RPAVPLQSPGGGGGKIELRRLDCPKCQDDPVSGNSCIDEFPRDSALRSIPLNPDLAIDDVDVDEATMDTPDALPSHQHQEIAIGCGVEHSLALNLTVGVGHLRVLSDDVLHELAIPFYGIHC